KRSRVHHDEIDFVHPPGWLAQRSRRQRRAIAETTLTVDDADLHVARELVMLQPIVGDDDVALLEIDQEFQGLHAIRSDDDRTAESPEQHGWLIAAFARVGFLGDAQRITLRVSVIAARDHARAITPLAQMLDQPDHERRLAGAADADVADDDHRDRRLVFLRPPSLPHASRRCELAEQCGERPQPPGRRLLRIPTMFQPGSERHAAILVVYGSWNCIWCNDA